MSAILGVKLSGTDGDCKNWYSLERTITILSTLAPGFVACLNIMTELGIGFGSEYTRPVNYQKNVTDTAHGIIWI